MKRGVKKEKFLKFIIVQKFFTGSLEFLLSLGVISFLNRDIEAVALNIVAYLDLDAGNYYIQMLIEKAGMISNGTLLGVSGGLFFFGVLALSEGWGLHKRKRWAEWLTVVSTAVFIPLEAYEIIRAVSIIKVGTLILNAAIVYYLARHKELFRKRAASLNPS